MNSSAFETWVPRTRGWDDLYVELVYADVVALFCVSWRIKIQRFSIGETSGGIFTPICGVSWNPIWRSAYFSDGLVQPPTSFESFLVDIVRELGGVRGKAMESSRFTVRCCSMKAFQLVCKWKNIGIPPKVPNRIGEVSSLYIIRNYFQNHKTVKELWVTTFH